MSIGAGLAAQVGFGQEAGGWNVPATPDHFPEFLSESVNYAKNILQGQGLHAGGQYDRASRRSVASFTASGDITFEHAVKGMGLYWKNNLGSTATPAMVATGAYKQIHQPGSLTGFGLSYQKGVPTALGVVVPLLFTGGKVGGWEFTVSDQQNAQLKETMDFANVSATSTLAAASYPTNNPNFNFSQAVVKLGGTAATTGGVVAITGGAALAPGSTSLASGFTLTGTNPMKTDRYGLGNAGLKAEQLENAFRSLSGTLDGEFVAEATYYPAMLADTGIPLEITLTGGAIGTSGFNYTLDIVLACVKFDTDDLSVSGPDVIGESPAFTVLDDGVNAPIQVTIISSDSTL